MPAIALALAMTLACVEGPFERRNPRDSGSGFECGIVAVRDTVREIGDWALFTLDCSYLVHTEVPTWTASAYLFPLGQGAFQLQSLPPGSLLATVYVRHYGLLDSAHVVILR